MYLVEYEQLQGDTEGGGEKGGERAKVALKSFYFFPGSLNVLACLSSRFEKVSRGAIPKEKSWQKIAAVSTKQGKAVKLPYPLPPYLVWLRLA